MKTLELGFLALERGDHQEAVNIFKRALDQGKDAEAFFGFGAAHFRLGDFLTARWAFYQALDLKPDHRAAREYVGRIERERTVKPPSARQSRFRAGKNYFEILDGTWKKFFLKGINIGLGLPGYFPGEFAIKRGAYLAWFDRIAALGVNSLRVYTLQPPGFYEALQR